MSNITNIYRQAGTSKRVKNRQKTRRLAEEKNAQMRLDSFIKDVKTITDGFIGFPVKKDLTDLFLYREELDNTSQ